MKPFYWLVMESRPTHRQLREFIILYTLVDKLHMSSTIRDDEHGASFAGEKLRLVQAVGPSGVCLWRLRCNRQHP